MAWLNGYSLIRLVLAFHIAMGVVLLRAPKLIAEQPMIFLLGEAVGLPHPKVTFHLNPLATSLLGIVLILSGLQDLIAVSQIEEVSRGYWDAQAPIRMAFFFVITGYTYLNRPGRGNTAAFTGDPLKNSLVFSWGFIEVILWFWIYQRLREERHGAQQRIENRKRMQAKLMGEDVDDFGR